MFDRASLSVFELDVLPLLGHDGASWGWGARLDVTGYCGIWWGEVDEGLG
jgi:hypothetical protein